VRFGQLPASLAVLAGVKPVVIAIVAQALMRLGRTALRTVPLALLAAAAVVATLVGVNELIVLLSAALVAMLASAITGPTRGAPVASSGAFLAGGFSWQSVTTLGAFMTAPVISLGGLFATFLKIGAVLFGSGYVLLAFLRADFVERLGWLTERQLLDAVAVGQVTPGPLFTTATFIGYVLAGVPGAIVATIGIFLPAFVFVAISGPLIPRLRRSRVAGAGLDGVNAASLALMAVVTWQLGRAALVDVSSAFIAVASATLLAMRRVNSAWLVLAGGLAGVAVAALRP